MIRIPGKIPVSIYPTFWLMAGIIGFLYSGSLVGTLIWMGIIFVSVLFHEFGHALTAYFFGQKPRIELVALGGLTHHDGDKLPLWKQFFIVLNGPLFGFILFIIAALLVEMPLFSSPLPKVILTLTRDVNFFWTIVNLVPVMPLDGGQLLRIIMESIFGLKGFRYALLSSAILSVLVSLAFFLYQAFFPGALFFLLAFQSFDSWRRTKNISEPDRSEAVKTTFEQAEEELRQGHKVEAKKLFDSVRELAKKGMVYNMATQYVAFLCYESGDIKEAYELLRSIQQELASDALCLLHKAAFEEKDYPLVVELSATCFQTLPTVETALRNAYAHAELSHVEATIGWLDTALREGLQNLNEILTQDPFAKIRKDPHFTQWLDSFKPST